MTPVRTVDAHVPAVAPAITVVAAAKLPALLVMVCGFVVLFCVGFLQTPSVHNAAHDTRHANGFPCH